MDALNLKNNNLENGQKKPCHVAERIFSMLNQGNLFEIHRILQELKDEEERKCVAQVFLEKFDFNFQKYI